MEAEMKSRKDNENEGHAQEILDNTYGKVDFSALANNKNTFHYINKRCCMSH
jgi:hypothetical protein